MILSQTLRLKMMPPMMKMTMMMTMRIPYRVQVNNEQSVGISLFCKQSP